MQVKHESDGHGGEPESKNCRLGSLLSIHRLHGDPRTKAYVERRTREGMSNKEIHRCLKRYIVRELYPLRLQTEFVLLLAPRARKISSAKDRLGGLHQWEKNGLHLLSFRRRSP